MDSKKETRTDRRSFLKLAGVGVVAGGAAIAASPQKADAKDGVAGGNSNYRETEHVKRYYELARF